MDTWLEKYRPNILDDYLDYKTKYAPILDPWITAYNNRRLPKQSYIMHKPFIILVGKPGVGKTTLAHCLFRSNDYHINECNASATRTKTALDDKIKTGKRVAGRGLRLQNVGVIMDEIDGLSINESNSINMLLDIVLLPMPKYHASDIDACQKYSPSDSASVTGISSTAQHIYHPRYPMILTANSIKERKFQRLLDMSIIINVESPSQGALMTLANKINDSEKIGLNQNEIEIIIKSLGIISDYRVVIQQLWRIHHAKIAGAANNKINTPLVSEVDKISLDNKLTRQLLYVSTMDIRDAIASIIAHQPYHLTLPPGEQRTLFYNEYYQQLTYIVNSDPNIFYLSIWENYALVLGQIYKSVVKSRIKSINKQNIQQRLWQAWRYITKCYQQCSEYDNYISVTQNWDIQPYIEIIGPLTGLRILNELNYLDTVTTGKPWISGLPKITYCTQYNNMKQDSAHITNQLRFRTITIPGDHNVSSKDLISNSKQKHIKKTMITQPVDPFAIYNPMLDSICYDPELFYIISQYPSDNTINNDNTYKNIVASYGIPGISVVKKLNKVYKKLLLSNP